MNWTWVCLFNLLLFNSCLTANIDIESSRSDIQQLNQSRNGARADAFNEDFLYPIFDLAEFEQILQMAKNPETADFVKNHIFPVKYPNFKFCLQIENDRETTMLWDSVYIHDFNMFVEVITHFGKHIKKLGIVNSEDINEEDSAVMYGSISEHCSNSLTSLTMDSIKEYILPHFTKPFPNMKRLDFNMKTNEIGSILPFDEIFPNLEFLRIDYFASPNNIQNNEKRFIEVELPAIKHLKHLNTYVEVRNSSDIATIQKQLGNMLQKNPQIQKIWYSPRLNDFIQEISEYLPNLEHFSIHDLDPEIRPVQFKSIKNFKVTSWGQPCPVERISFSNLDTLEMTYDTVNISRNTRDSWMEFFRNHQNLRQLNCHATTEEGLVEFLAELPNLYEIRIHSFQPFDIDFVRRLIESPNNWVKFHYDANPRDETVHLDMDAFVEKFENEWNITYSFEGRQFIEFERRN